MFYVVCMDGTIRRVSFKALHASLVRFGCTGQEATGFILSAMRINGRAWSWPLLAPRPFRYVTCE